MNQPITTGVGVTLPADARKWLVEAAQITDPDERIRAVEEAIRRAKLRYPTFFQQEQQT